MASLRENNDFYPTPHSIINRILVDIKSWSIYNIWEPCAGDGRFVAAMQASGLSVPYKSDIYTGQDFFDYKEALSDTIITNPPFKPIRKFIDHAFNIGVKRMILVCPERLWACKKGFAQWNRHRPSKFVFLTWREDYLRKGGAPDRSLAVAIWDEPHSEKCNYEIWDKI